MDIIKPEKKKTSLPMLITFGCMVAALIFVILRLL
jgi:hypothetical protein